MCQCLLDAFFVDIIQYSFQKEKHIAHILMKQKLFNYIIEIRLIIKFIYTSLLCHRLEQQLHGWRWLQHEQLDGQHGKPKLYSILISQYPTTSSSNTPFVLIDFTIRPLKPSTSVVFLQQDKHETSESVRENVNMFTVRDLCD